MKKLGLLDSMVQSSPLYLPKQAGIRPLWQNTPGYHTLVQERVRSAKGLVEGVPSDKKAKRLPVIKEPRVAKEPVRKKVQKEKVSSYINPPEKTRKAKFDDEVKKARKTISRPKEKVRGFKPLVMPADIKVTGGKPLIQKPRDDRPLKKLEAKLAKLNSEIYGILKEVKSIRENV